MAPLIVFGILAEAAGLVLVVIGIVAGNPAMIAFGVPLLLIGTVFWVVGLRTGAFLGGGKMRSILGASSRLLERGAPARAVVQAISETGITINEAPVFGFDLEVHREGQPPYPVTVKQLVPRMLVGAVLPGSEVTVRIDLADSSNVAIDWSQAPHPAGTATAAPDPADLIRSIPPERRGSAAELLARGRRGTARIVAARAMGDAVELGVMTPGDERAGAQMALLELEVKLPGQDPYPATVLHWVPPRLLGQVGPGREVVVAVGREDPAHEVAIDWEAAPG